MTSPVRTYQFGNGIRLIHRPNDSAVAHFGLIVHTGTRDERKDEHGIAHFLEHMFFKGTRKRSPYQIISRLEDTGGEINAYTTKEETALYATFLREDYKKAMELIHDIFLHSTFPEKERQKETEVILNEIQGYDETPSELIFDRAEELLFPGHSIGRNILGTSESLGSFGNGMLEEFLTENYATEEMVLSFAGSVPFERVLHAAERYFGSIQAKSRIRERIRPESASGMKLIEKRDTFQKHAMLVGKGFPLPDDRRLQLYLLINILGGPGMNSRLNMALRERRGYSYSAEAHYAPYTDTGAVMVYFSCDPERFAKTLQLTREEMKKLRTRAISDKRLIHAKKQLLGQLAISRENNEHLMLTTGKSFLVFDRVDSLEFIGRQLEDITAGHLLDTANQVLDNATMNLLIFE